jgi:2-dehydro-3-deoxygalactonokinase
MESAALASPALIGLDWGTSSLRAYLIDGHGAVLGERDEPWGIMHLGDRDYVRACGDITAQWKGAAALPMIACGMVGSAHGWVETPYCPAPAGAAALANSLTTVTGTNVHIVAGIAQHGDADVMRGEETQIIGARSLHARLAHDARVVCPGTHSKWVTVRNGDIDAFTTYMTGELFAVLSAHSILGRFARDTGMSDNSGTDAFRLGVRTARNSKRDSAALLFSVRARVLLGELQPEQSLNYLSGVLIGSELRSGLTDHAAPTALIGAPALCALYMQALREFDVPDVLVIDQSAPRGLWQIATAAGLCPSEVVTPERL